MTDQGTAAAEDGEPPNRRIVLDWDGPWKKSHRPAPLLRGWARVNEALSLVE